MPAGVADRVDGGPASISHRHQAAVAQGCEVNAHRALCQAKMIGQLANRVLAREQVPQQRETSRLAQRAEQRRRQGLVGGTGLVLVIDTTRSRRHLTTIERRIASDSQVGTSTSHQPCWPTDSGPRIDALA